MQTIADGYDDIYDDVEALEDDIIANLTSLVVRFPKITQSCNVIHCVITECSIATSMYNYEIHCFFSICLF